MKKINDLENIDIWGSKVNDMSMQPKTYSKILLIWLAWDKTDDKISKYSGLSDSTYTDLRSYRQFFITATTLGLYN